MCLDKTDNKWISLFLLWIHPMIYEKAWSSHLPTNTSNKHLMNKLGTKNNEHHHNQIHKKLNNIAIHKIKWIPSIPHHCYHCHQPNTLPRSQTTVKFIHITAHMNVNKEVVIAGVIAYNYHRIRCLQRWCRHYWQIRCKLHGIPSCKWSGSANSSSLNKWLNLFGMLG